MSEEQQYVGIKVQDYHKTLAREFVGLVFPRLMNQFTDQAQHQIMAMKNIMSSKSDKLLTEELQKAESKLKKALSEEVMEKVIDTMVELLQEALDPKELEYAIYQERITIKISGIAARLETAFNEALGEA